MSAPVIAALLERSVNSVYDAATLQGLAKSSEYRARANAAHGRRLIEAGKNHRFQKGLIPANKGTRRPGWAPGRMRETQFKKGQRNYHQMDVGSTRLIAGYLYLKVAEVPNVPYTVNWQPLHILNWEIANGRALPLGHCLWFRDGNRLNVEPENLELITRAENMRRNTIHNLPRPLKEVVQLRAALERQIRRKERNAERRQHD